MPFYTLKDGATLYYEQQGEGTPIIFIHGVWMSSRFFNNQLSFFSKQYQTILLDLRGHGNSSHTPYGHTISTYARDVHEFINNNRLKDVILVGWSMGAFVVWEYLKQFGEENVKGNIIVDEMASDFKWSDFPIGAFDLPALISLMQGIQLDRTSTLESFIPLMFKDELTEEDKHWIMKEVTKMPESIASAILFDQSIVDYRDFLSFITIPTLLCFGKEEKLIPVAAGIHIQKLISGSVLEVFENSCHCPFLEESDRFNKVVSDFIEHI
ncbi:alpha/beta hydrolase [Priestia aryabhattai]|uniref:alpha/beta fold hydrolase n=1 Tax=Priestia aryabhattai TaxID=412384 RepID=UPI002E1EF497